MGAMASQIVSSLLLTHPFIQGADQRKHQSSASLAFVRGIHRWPMNSPHKWPVTRKMFPFDDVIMTVYISSRKTYTGCRWVSLCYGCMRSWWMYITYYIHIVWGASSAPEFHCREFTLKYMDEHMIGPFPRLNNKDKNPAPNHNIRQLSIWFVRHTICFVADFTFLLSIHTQYFDQMLNVSLWHITSTFFHKKMKATCYFRNNQIIFIKYLFHRLYLLLLLIIFVINGYITVNIFC